MSGVAPQLWVFEHPSTLSQEQWQQWHTACYLETAVDALLQDPLRSVVVSTGAGCGITTSLSLLRRAKLLTFRYDPDQWPGQAQAFTSAPDHFGQWMAHVAYILSEELKTNPEHIHSLPLTNHEFLIWLLRRYLGRRQGDSWLRYVQAILNEAVWQALELTVTSQSFNEMYGDTVADLYGQIDECLDIARRLGWQGIYASIDIRWLDWLQRSTADRATFLAQIKQLLTVLTPLQRPGFGLKMGVPRQLVSVQEIREMVRGRVTVTAYMWTLQELDQLAQRLLILAMGEQPSRFPDATLWTILAPDINAIWGEPGPAAAAAVAQHYAVAVPSGDVDLQKLRYQLYRQAAILRLDHDQRTVWRGMTPITLDETPFRVFEVLWRHQGKFASNEALLGITGSSVNLDKNISRIREALEPFYKDKNYMYVQRTPSSGTWLDKEVCSFT